MSCEGVDGVMKCFTGSFERFSDMSGLQALVQGVKEASASEPGTVFLIWSAAASGYVEATDTVVCDSEGKRAHQNGVITYSNPKKEGKSVVEPAQVAPKGHGPVHDAWQNHFSVFGAHDVENIVKD